MPTIDVTNVCPVCKKGLVKKNEEKGIWECLYCGELFTVPPKNLKSREECKVFSGEDLLAKSKEEEKDLPNFNQTLDPIVKWDPSVYAFAHRILNDSKWSLEVDCCGDPETQKRFFKLECKRLARMVISEENRINKILQRGGPRA